MLVYGLPLSAFVLAELNERVVSLGIHRKGSANGSVAVIVVHKSTGNPEVTKFVLLADDGFIRAIV
jgi:hypothetical protein